MSPGLKNIYIEIHIENKRVGDIQKKFSTYYGMATGPMVARLCLSEKFGSFQIFPEQYLFNQTN